jgi:hypothetical protein
MAPPSNRLNRRPETKIGMHTDLLALSRSAGEDVVNAAMAQHISAVGRLVATNGRSLPADPDTLRGLIGREPVTMRDFLRANLDSFARLAVHRM